MTKKEKEARKMSLHAADSFRSLTGHKEGPGKHGMRRPTPAAAATADLRGLPEAGGGRAGAAASSGASTTEPSVCMPVPPALQGAQIEDGEDAGGDRKGSRVQCV